MQDQTPICHSNERQFRWIAKQLPIGIYIVQDNRFVFINPRFKHYTGYTWAELLKTPDSEIVHPGNRVKVRQCTIRMLKYGRIEPYQYRALHKNGEIRWILETDSAIGLRGHRARHQNVVGYDSGRKGRIGISTCHTGNWVERRIDDDGSGIPESIREQLFNLFFTTKEAGKGTGLIVKLPIGTDNSYLRNQH